MKINTKTRYGIRAMIEIARETDDSGIFQKDIAERQDLSIKYLDQIIAALKVSGLITNVKGKKSGYILTKPVNEITLYDIYTAFIPAPNIVDCLEPNYKCDKKESCATRHFYVGLNNIIIEYLQSFTLDKLLKNQVSLDNNQELLFFPDVIKCQ